MEPDFANPTRRMATRITVAATTMAVTVATFAPVVGAQDQPTTTTLPEDNSDLGRIIPLPNSGHKPIDAGDRGGWQQITLFFAICAVIIGIAAFVWLRSRRARAQRRAAGHDPVAMAKAHGGDVRAPRPPGISD